MAADERYREGLSIKKKEHQKDMVAHRQARSFVNTKVTEEDLDEFQSLIEDKRKSETGKK